jgi:hypothetical protein
MRSHFTELVVFLRGDIGFTLTAAGACVCRTCWYVPSPCVLVGCLESTCATHRHCGSLKGGV